MNDRGMIKWLPFNSVISTNYILQELNEQKKKVHLPILSEEQKFYIEKKIINAYYTQEKIKIKYFYNGVIYQNDYFVKKINAIKKEIILNDSFKLNFQQIIDIN